MTPDSKVLLCPHCPRRFNMEAHLQRHINAYHPDAAEAKAPAAKEEPKETPAPPTVDTPDGSTPDSEAPYGRKKDGTPMKRRGRRKGSPQVGGVKKVETAAYASRPAKKTLSSPNGILAAHDAMRVQLADVVKERDDLLDRFVGLSQDYSRMQDQLNAAKEALK